MKKIWQTINRIGLVLIFGTALSLSACSTGTKDGETNVEDSDAKDKNPENQNVQQAEPEAAAINDSIANSDDPDANKTYQKVDPDNGARDADNDGKVDQ
jgi:hypothetical protein